MCDIDLLEVATFPCTFCDVVPLGLSRSSRLAFACFRGTQSAHSAMHGFAVSKSQAVKLFCFFWILQKANSLHNIWNHVETSASLADCCHAL